MADQVVIAVIVSFFGYILYGAAGFGAAMIFHSLWTLLELFDVTDGSVAEATYYLNIMTLMVTLIMGYNNRALIQWSFVTFCTIPWFGMNVLGCYLLIGTSNDILKVILGCVLAGIFFYQTIKTFYQMCSGKMLQEKLNQKGPEIIPLDQIPEVDLKTQWHWLLFVGCGGGILSGLFNMPGPSTIVVLLFSGIHRERWKSNFFVWQIPAQFFVVWFLSTKGELYDHDMWYWYIIMCISAVIASKIGNALGRLMSQTTFTFVVIALSLLGAVSDFSVLLPEKLKEDMVVGAFFGAGLLLIFMFYTLYRTVFKPFRELRNIDNGGGMIKIHDIKLDDEVKLVEADSQRNIDVNDIKGKNASKVGTMDAGGARFGVGRQI